MKFINIRELSTGTSLIDRGQRVACLLSRRDAEEMKCQLPVIWCPRSEGILPVPVHRPLECGGSLLPWQQPESRVPIVTKTPAEWHRPDATLDSNRPKTKAPSPRYGWNVVPTVPGKHSSSNVHRLVPIRGSALPAHSKETGQDTQPPDSLTCQKPVSNVFTGV